MSQHAEKGKLKRKGNLTRGREGEIILKNENNEEFVVDEVIAVIWFECDGKSIDELTDQFLPAVNVDRETLRKDINTVIEKLKNVNLVETI